MGIVRIAAPVCELARNDRDVTLPQRSILMGKFDGVLLVADYDDTLYCHGMGVSAVNRAAIESFIAQGGTFTIATGRARNTFEPQIARERLTLNAPVILSNGSDIYDFNKGEVVYQSYLPDQAAAHAATLCEQFPTLAVEAYHAGDLYTYRPNAVTQRHLNRVQVPSIERASLSDIPQPWTKMILQERHELLEQVRTAMLERWGDLYEAIFSNRSLLEVTAKGCHKGTMVARLACELGFDFKNVYCVGDNRNDIPMLALSAIPFAPANCTGEVRSSGARIVRHCNDSAIAHVIEILDSMY